MSLVKAVILPLIFVFFLPVYGMSVEEMDKLESLNSYDKTVHVLNCGTIRNKSKYLHTKLWTDIPMDIVRVLLSLNYKLPTGSNSIYKTNPCLLVRNNGKYLLWEAGNPDSIIDEYGPKGKGKEKDGFIGYLTRFLFRFYVTEYGLIRQLDDLGVKPEDVNYIALSHLHYDHAGNMELFPNAQILIQKEELDAYNSPTPAKDYHYDMDILTTLPNQVQIVTEDNADVFGDGSAMLIKSPGHTPGHQILRLNLNAGVRYLSGDLYASVSNFMKFTYPERKAKFPVPYFNFDHERTVESYKEMDNLLREDNARIWIQHAARSYTTDINKVGLSPKLDSQFLERIYMGVDYFYTLK